jgi:4-carboxymuconolactone decarboxylase
VTRLDLLDLEEIPGEYHHLFTDDYLGDRHIFRVWAHNPELLEATLEYLNTVYEQLTPRTKELVMRAIGGGDLSPFPDEEYVLLQYARAVATGDVTDQVHAALCGAYDPGKVVAVGLLVDFYVGLCNYVAAVELPFEGGQFVGWTPEEDTVAELFG